MATLECTACGDTHGEVCPYLTTCQYCDKPTDDYEATAKDAELVSAERLCEECHLDEVRAVRRERVRVGLEGAEESRGVSWREA